MPDPLSRDHVARIAALAGLDLPEIDLDRLARELTAILTFADRIAAVDTRGVAIEADPTGLPAPLRPDRAVPGLRRDEALAAAPETEAGFFTVPRVLP